MAAPFESFPASGSSTSRATSFWSQARARIGRPEQAEAHARAALSIFEAHRIGAPTLAEARSVLGGALAARGSGAEAEALLRAAVAELAAARGARPGQLRAAQARLRRWTMPVPR